MLRRRFFYRLLLGYVAIVVLTAGLVGVLTGLRVSRDFHRRIGDELRRNALLLEGLMEDAFGAGSDPGLQRQVVRLGRATGVRITLVDTEGTVLADSDRDPELMDNHLGRREIRRAAEEGEGRAERYSDTVQHRMMYHALRVGGSRDPLGFIRVSLPLTQVEARLAAVRHNALVGALVAVAAGLVLGLVFARRVTRPISDMTEVAQAYAAGDYDRKVATTRQDEIGRLAASFNAMAESLERRMRTMAEERSKLSAVLGGMVEGVVAVDPGERILHMNEVAGRLLGARTQDIEEKTVQEVCRVPEVPEMLRAAMRSAEPVEGRARLAGRPHDRVLEMRASRLKSTDGRVVGAVLVIHDVTVLHRMEQVRKDFVANVSHELKTPLTALGGILETLRKDGSMPAETRDRFLDRMSVQVERLRNLVADLLTLSRVESGLGTMERRSVDLRETVTGSCRGLASMVETAGVMLNAELPPDPVPVQGDPAALQQIVDNLVDNAVKYTDQGGRVVVELARREGSAVLEVRDTGIGIEPRHQARIFERFYRVDKARSRDLGGTGLGLSIVKHLVQAHGGEIALESTPGRGSTFRVWIPLDPDAGDGAG